MAVIKPSLTTWVRLEPVSRDIDLQSALMARVADPLWMLARQWQTTEFAAEDAGSPVVAELEAEVSQLARYRAGRAEDTPAHPTRTYDPQALPLETLVEREPHRGASPLERRLPAEAGLHFLRLLDRNGVGKLRNAYLAQYPLPPLTDQQAALLDEQNLRFLQILAGRSLDGAKLFADLLPRLRPPSGSPSLPPEPPVGSADRPKVIKAGLAFLTWYESLFSEGNPEDRPWSSSRMEYEFAVAAPRPGGELVLSARGYPGGRLDWDAFDLDLRGTSLGAADAKPAPATVKLAALPRPIAFKGMPADRYWEFEDAQVDIGALEAGPEDLLRLTFMDFALLHGNDWFMFPWELPIGALARVRSLKVRDTFGETKVVRSAQELDPSWALFRLSELGTPPAGQPSPSPDLLFLAPSLASTVTAPPLEEVLLARDEMANYVWGIERAVVGPRERALDRHEAFQAQRRRLPEPSPPPADANDDSKARRYVLQSVVPEYWIPFVPVQLPGSRTRFRLRRGLLDRPGGPVPPLGRLLDPGRPLIMHEEDVPRVGVRLTRGLTLTRWLDGLTYLWVGREKQIGRGEASSGLRYDFVE